MTYREVADRCGQFTECNYDFSKEVDAWEDFFVLYEDKNGDSTEENLLDRLSCEVVQVKRIVDKLDFKDNYQLRNTVALMLSDFRRIKYVLQALLHLDGIFMLYKNHMDEAKNNLMKEANKLVRDVYELDKLEETNETTENTTSGSPA